MTCEYYQRCLDKLPDYAEYDWPDMCTLGIGGSGCVKWRNYKWNEKFEKR